MRPAKRIVIVLITTGAVLMIAGVTLFLNRESSTIITINYSNAKEVTVSTTVSEYDGPVDTITLERSGQSVSIPSNAVVSIDYKGADGYADGYTTIEEGSTSVAIDPDYSDTRKLNLMTSISPIVEHDLYTRYPNTLRYYKLESRGLYHKGEWYFGELIYQGEADLETDNLRVIYRKNGNSWVPHSNPQVNLTIHNTNGVPENILAEVDLIKTPTQED